MSAHTYDVAVVGASIAGSTTAALLGRAGLRVALIERHRDPGAFKVLCTHHVMACATPTIGRIGLDRAIESAGGVRNGLDSYTPWGWVVPPPDSPHGYSIRRSKLDPMVRSLAAESPGVDLVLGYKAVDLIDGDGTVAGVRLRGVDGSERAVHARLVVGADGAHSTVARLAGATEKIAPNERCPYFAQFTGVRLTSAGRSQIWLHDPGTSYALPNDDGLTVLATMPTKSELPRFRHDLESSFLETLRSLPDGPDLSSAERVSKIVGSNDYPLVRRSPVPAPGVVLVGDAALTSDPAQGVGCGWAFQSAEWLADSVAPALLGGRPLGRALRRYQRLRKPMLGHHGVIESEAKATPPSRLDRLMFGAAVHDVKTAVLIDALTNRTAPVWRFLAPHAMARAAWVNARTRRSDVAA